MAVNTETMATRELSTWGRLSPVTRRSANPKAYNRKKAQRPDDGDAGGDVFVTSERARYDRAESLVVLTGDPLVRRAANQVAGDEISYNLNTGSIRSRGFRGTGVLPAEETP